MSRTRALHALVPSADSCHAIECASFGISITERPCLSFVCTLKYTHPTGYVLSLLHSASFCKPFHRIRHRVLQVLIDGNFVATAERLKMEWARLIPKLFQVEPEQCHFHITECVIAELQSLGEKFAAVVDVAKSLPLLKCRKKHGHTHDMDASTCFKQLVGGDNSGKWIVITQDADLRTALRGVPGTPLALISNNVLVLEPPSNDSRASTAEAEAGKVVLSKEEAKAVRAAGAQLREAGMLTGTAGAAKADVVGSLAPKFKHHAAGPNPLSMRKKKRVADEVAAGQPSTDDSSTVHRKRRRKEKRLADDV